MIRVLLMTTLFVLTSCGTDEPYSELTSTNEIIVFEIAEGTGKNAWNTKETMITLKVGDTLRIVNKDTIDHRLHTNGTPCAHGPNQKPGASFDCVISKTHDPDTQGALYDHHVGQTASFWIKAVE